MVEKYKHKIVIGCEILLLCMIMTIIGTNAESSKPPSNGVSYSKNSQTTVEGALNDLYTKANYGNATASQILKGKTALVGGKQVTGTYEAPTLTSQTKDATAGAGDILKDKTAYVNGSKITGTMANKGAVTGTVNPGGSYTIPAGYHNGSGKATCATCESKGYSHVISFVENVSAYKVGVNGNTLSDGTMTRFCPNNKSCTFQFSVKLNEKLPSNTTDYVCSAVLLAGEITNKETIDISSRGVFRIGRGYSAANTGATAQYWYLDHLMAMSDHAYMGNGIINDTFGDMIDAYAGISSTGGSGTASTSCEFKNGTFIMQLHLSDNGLSTNKNKFGLIGLVAY